jgi:hypothetical protein
MTRRCSILFFLSLMALGSGCPQTGTGFNPNPSQDMSGNYESRFLKPVIYKLDLGQGIRGAVSQTFEGLIEFGNHEDAPLYVDLGAFCSRLDVICPPAVMPLNIAVEQVDGEAVFSSHGVRVHDVSETPILPLLLLSGIVDHNDYDRFLLSLTDVISSPNQACALLESSRVEGRFSREYETILGNTVTWEEGEPVAGMADGKIILSWSAQCVFGDIVPPTATFTIEASFSAQRLGKFALLTDDEQSQAGTDVTDDAADALDDGVGESDAGGNDADGVAPLAPLQDTDAGPNNDADASSGPTPDAPPTSSAEGSSSPSE